VVEYHEQIRKNPSPAMTTFSLVSSVMHPMQRDDGYRRILLSQERSSSDESVGNAVIYARICALQVVHDRQRLREEDANVSDSELWCLSVTDVERQ
jgi:hypothetical protein